MRKISLPKELLWLFPAGLALGALLSSLQPGAWWIGWLAFSSLLILGGWGLVVLWRWAGKGRALAGMIALALGLRLLAGLALTLLLPSAGYEDPQQDAGYVFYDSWKRDTQAWDLANSSDPLSQAFDKQYASDQYGGLLFVSAVAYRGLSPDAHRPLLIILLAALAAAAGIPFAVRAANKLWGPAIALPAGWILALYPESILQGSAQMREPFLISLLCLLAWGFADWQGGSRRGLAWLVGGAIGLLVFSPGVLIFAVILLAGWWWFGREHARLGWPVLLGGALALALGLALFAWGVGIKPTPGGLVAWFREAAGWDIYLTVQSSGWVEKVLSEMPSMFRLPFLVGYGLAQPVLPASIFEPTLPIWRAVGVPRALGWYLLAPLLVYAPLAALREKDRVTRAVWLWLAACGWAWILLSSVRAGGDQWDNPRYRVMPLFLLAFLVSYAWLHRERWFWRLVAIEGVFLAFFFQWYVSRYTGLIRRFGFFQTVGLVAGLSALILLGGWVLDFWRTSRKRS